METLEREEMAKVTASASAIRLAIAKDPDQANYKLAKSIGGGATTKKVAKERKEFDRLDIDLAFGLSVDQAAFLLAISPRRVRAICQEGRLGRRIGKRQYIIEADNLLAFASLDRPCGTPGHAAVREEGDD